MEKAVQLIMAKGYDHTEANEIAMQCFDNAERAKNGMSIEWWIDQIANKEEWVQNCK
jgi:citrate synthase